MGRRHAFKFERSEDLVHRELEVFSDFVERITTDSVRGDKPRADTATCDNRHPGRDARNESYRMLTTPRKPAYRQAIRSLLLRRR